MILAILVMLKTILFINITNIKHNAFIIFLFTVLVSLLILTTIEFSKIKHKKKIQIIFYTIFSFIAFVDIMYYSYFQSLPSLAILGQAKQLGDVGDSIKELLTIKNLLFIIDLPITIYYIIKIQKQREYSKKLTIWVPTTIGALILSIILITMQNNKFVALKNQEIYTFHATDIINTYFRNASTAKDTIDIKEILGSKEDENFENLKYTGIGKDKNLIVIQVEALQDFVINLNYNNQEITPNLNKLIKDKSSIYFDEYFQMLGRGNTSDAEFVTQNSLYPSMEDYTYNQYADNTFYGLPWLLREQGYNAWVFHGFRKDFWNREKAYINQGFQRFLSEENYYYKEKIGFGISDAEFFDQTMDYLKELDKIDENPFYAFIITLSSHTPYNIDPKYHVLDIRDEHKGNIVANYLQAIHYADQELGRFIENLKKEGLYEDTVIALYGDHFGINNSAEEVFEPMEDILGEPYNFDHIMNVPLIIHVPGEEINQTISKVGSQLDFYPTISNIMGYKNKKGFMMGQDLINSNKYNFVAAQTIMRKGSFIDKDIIFNISQDGIFDNSTVIDRKTRKQLDVNQYREIYDKVIDEINKSDTILKYDLLKYLVENDGNIDNIKINTTNSLGVPSQDKIQTYENYTIEELDNNYSAINKIMRLYTDSKTTNIKELSTWMRNNKGAYMILTTEESAESLEKIIVEYNDLRDRYIAEIDDFDKYFFVQRGGYKNIILNIINQSYTDEEIIDFLRMHSCYAVIMDKSREDTDLSNKLKDMGVRVYWDRGTGVLSQE